MNSLRSTFSFAIRLLSSDTKRQTVVCGNGVIAAWHPQTEFPYEHSRPVVLKNKESKSSPFTSSALSSGRRPQPPSNDDLKEIFYTDKNEWYTRTREDRLRSVAAPLPKRK